MQCGGDKTTTLVALHEQTVTCGDYMAFVRDLSAAALRAFPAAPVVSMADASPCSTMNGRGFRRWLYEGQWVGAPIGISMNNLNIDRPDVDERPTNRMAAWNKWSIGRQLYALGYPMLYEFDAHPPSVESFYWTVLSGAGNGGSFILYHSPWSKSFSQPTWDVVDYWLASQRRAWLVFRDREYPTYDFTSGNGASGSIGDWGKYLRLLNPEDAPQACSPTLARSARAANATAVAGGGVNVIPACPENLPTPAITPAPTPQPGPDLTNRLFNRQARRVDAGKTLRIAAGQDWPAWGATLPVEITVSYFDMGRDAFDVVLPGADGQPARHTIAKSGSGIWQQAVWSERIRVGNLLDGNTFLQVVNDTGGVEYLHEIYVTTPSGAPIPTPAFSPTATPTQPALVAPTVTATPILPSATPTRAAIQTWTATSLPTASPTNTPTRTFTPVPPSATPTRAPTQTWTPTSLPIATPTNPPTGTFTPIPPSATPTRALIATPTATNPPTTPPTATRAANAVVTATPTYTITPSPAANSTSILEDAPPMEDVVVPSPTATPTPVPTRAPTAVVTPITVRAKVEIVWPHGGVGVQDADRANVTAYLLAGAGVGSGARSLLDSVPCAWAPAVRLWGALNNDPARLLGLGEKRLFSAGGRTYPVWDFNDVDVQAARDPANRFSLFVTVDSQAGPVEAMHNVWTHAADARTLFAQQDQPTEATALRPLAVDAKIQIVWPHDDLPVREAQRANITAYVFVAGTQLALSPAIVMTTGWSPTVRLHWSLNNEPEGAPGVGLVGTARVVTAANGVKFLAWDFNDVDVSLANEPLNRLYFWVSVDGITTHSNIWAHAADARTLFPQPDVLNSCQ